MTPFKEAVNKAMLELAKDERAIFVGQSVCFDGAAIFDSLKGVPMEKRLEMPVIEDFQMGFCTGLALAGRLPICIYPRMDFMLLCLNQLVNHLDKMPHFGWEPKVIIRTTVGATKPLNAGPQHTQDHGEAFSKMLTSVQVLKAREPDEVLLAYSIARASKCSSLIVENEQCS